MRVALVTGEYPPDIGGTATHSADLVDEISRRGHTVRVISLSDGSRLHERRGVVRYPRTLPWPLRLAAVAWWLFRHRREYDIVYAPSLHPAAVVGARAGRRPVVLRIPGDHAWERGRRLGLTNASFEEFQRTVTRGPRLRAMCWVRNWSVQHADALVAPSHHLREAAERWAHGLTTVVVIPNGVRISSPRTVTRPQDDFLRAVFVGRLISLKRVGVLIGAVARAQWVLLEVIGEGPERSALERKVEELRLIDRVTFAGRVEHNNVLERLSAADVLVLASEEEGLSTVAVEALACGTPVVAPAVGGIPEVVRHEESGLLVDRPDPQLLADALARLRDDTQLRRRLMEGASRSAHAWRLEPSAEAIEKLLGRLISQQVRLLSLPEKP